MKRPLKLVIRFLNICFTYNYNNWIFPLLYFSLPLAFDSLSLICWTWLTLLFQNLSHLIFSFLCNRVSCSEWFVLWFIFVLWSLSFIYLRSSLNPFLFPDALFRTVFAWLNKAKADLLFHLRFCLRFKWEKLFIFWWYNSWTSSSWFWRFYLFETYLFYLVFFNNIFWATGFLNLGLNLLSLLFLLIKNTW